MPVKSVGVTGDGRSYGNVVSLRAVKTVDFMTAKTFDFPFGFPEEVSTRIINEVPEISKHTRDTWNLLINYLVDTSRKPNGKSKVFAVMDLLF